MNQLALEIRVGGRKLDPIWIKYDKLESKADCKEMLCFAAIVDRMKKHSFSLISFFFLHIYFQPIERPMLRDLFFSTQKTSEEGNQYFDELDGFFFDNNLVFETVESDIFRRLMCALRPSFQRQQVLGSEVVDSVYRNTVEDAKHLLKGRRVTVVWMVGLKSLITTFKLERYKLMERFTWSTPTI